MHIPIPIVIEHLPIQEVNIPTIHHIHYQHHEIWTWPKRKAESRPNEKLKALRIVIANVDENTLNETLRTVVAFEEQLQDFRDWGLNPPTGDDEWMECISEPISDHTLQKHYNDPPLSLRVVARHVGNRQRRSIMEAVFKKTLSGKNCEAMESYRPRTVLYEI